MKNLSGKHKSAVVQTCRTVVRRRNHNQDVFVLGDAAAGGGERKDLSKPIRLLGKILTPMTLLNKADALLKEAEELRKEGYGIAAATCREKRQTLQNALNILQEK